MSEEKDLSKLTRDILSDIIVHMKYAKYIPELKRRENWYELVYRIRQMHIDKFPELEEEIKEAFQFVFDKKVLTSMRMAQFAGRPVLVSPIRGYNCSYAAADDWRIFSEAMAILLFGAGFGFSVQRHHVDKLPEVKGPNKNITKRFLVGDSVEGWADAVKALMQSYFFGKPQIRFDFSDIRQKGSLLVTSGGKAPGPEPLKVCLFKVENILSRKKPNEKLSSLEVHDIICHIADSVRSGGIRRSSLISLFNVDDEEMLNCKTGNWWEDNPQRALSNNSAVMIRHKLDEETFRNVLKRTEFSKAGEPGIFLSNDKEVNCNPCNEISLKSNQFCNLTSINSSNLVDQEDFEKRCWAASFIGTLQASYTDFHYLRSVWKKVTEKEALLGVSMTGNAYVGFDKFDLKSGAKVVKETNKALAKRIGINSAARLTCQKPDGSTSLVLGTSSGIHTWFAKFYIRRIRVGKNESIYKYLFKNHPHLVEDDFFKPLTEAIISVPIKAPEGALTREEKPIELLERVKRMHRDWVKPGHVSGPNTNNVSVTVSVKDDEWEDVVNWMWENKEHYNGISLLPYDGGTYKQAPFEEITEEQFLEMASKLDEIDLDYVVEEEDQTSIQGTVSCGSGGCEVT